MAYDIVFYIQERNEAQIVPLQIIIPNGQFYVYSPIYKRQTRLVSGQQTDMFYVYNQSNGFHWIDCSLCSVT